MRELIIMVGLPGSGKTTFCEQHPKWTVLSKDAIRRTIFWCSYLEDYEWYVRVIFEILLTSALKSTKQVICVDNTNVTKRERAFLVDAAVEADRKLIAYVMPLLNLEELYEKKQQQLRELRKDHEIKVYGFPRSRFVKMYNGYEMVTKDEGFDEIRYVEYHEIKPPDEDIITYT